MKNSNLWNWKNFSQNASQQYFIENIETQDAPCIKTLKKQILQSQITMGLLIVGIPVLVSAANYFYVPLWKTSLVVLGMLALVAWIYQRQLGYHKRISEFSFQLSVGSRLYRKTQSRKASEVYFIFQEGHRYYYLENIDNGEKRLVAKERILSDYDLAPVASDK